MAKFKFPLEGLLEYWDVLRYDYVVSGYRYNGQNVFSVYAKSKADALESMNLFKEKRCE